MPNDITVILADGDFPQTPIPLKTLREAGFVVCCDGAAASLTGLGIIPDCIVGDLDSLPEKFKERFSDRLVHVKDQETNDLTKAFNFCCRTGRKNIVILGATGKREDHTLGNLSLLSEYAKAVPEIKCVTNYGVFHIVSVPGKIPSHPGQQISIIALTPDAEVSSEGLKYPLDRLILKHWWQATLNEALGDSFSLDFPEGVRLLVFQEHKKSERI
ncbi:MAG: thiamine diphosphokinase [Lentisphaeria bacterium]|nr:thiamine diphosphokinase [Lentisphaeria bacterium]